MKRFTKSYQNYFNSSFQCPPVITIPSSFPLKIMILMMTPNRWIYVILPLFKRAIICLAYMPGKIRPRFLWATIHLMKHIWEFCRMKVTSPNMSKSETLHYYYYITNDVSMYYCIFCIHANLRNILADNYIHVITYLSNS